MTMISKDNACTIIINRGMDRVDKNEGKDTNAFDTVRSDNGQGHGITKTSQAGSDEIIQPEYHHTAKDQELKKIPLNVDTLLNLEDEPTTIFLDFEHDGPNSTATGKSNTFETVRNKESYSLLDSVQENYGNEQNKSECHDGETSSDNAHQWALDRGWGWFIVLGAFLNHLILGGFQKSSGVTYLQLLERFQKGATETSWVLALPCTLTFVMGPVVSALCTKFSIRFVVFLGASLSVVGYLISGLSPNLGTMYFSYGLLTGFGWAMVYSPALVTVSSYFNKRLGLAIGLATCGSGVGNFIFPPVFEKLFDFYGFTGTFLVLAAISCHFFVSGSLFRSLELQYRLSNHERNKENRRQTVLPVTQPTLPEASDLKQKHQLTLTPSCAVPPRSIRSMKVNPSSRKGSYISRKISAFKCAISATSSENKNKTKKPYLELSLLKNFAFTALCVQLLLFDATFRSVFVFLPALAQTKGLSKIEGAYLLSVIGLSDALSRVPLSTLLDMKHVKRYRLIIFNILMFSVGVFSVITPLMKTFWQFVILSCLYGIVTAICVSQKSMVLMDILGPEKLSSSFGLLLLFQGIGSLIGPIIGALFKDFLGSYDMSFYYGSSGIFVGALLLASGNIWLHFQRRDQLKN